MTRHSESSENHVLITSRSFSSGETDLMSVLQSAGLQPVRSDTTHDLSRMKADLDAAVAWIAGTSPITAAHVHAAPNLRVIARYGVGVDSVDLEAARSAGIIVTNTPGANSVAVAEHAIALLLAVVRGISEGDRRVRRDQWTTLRGHQIAGRTAGVLGFGHIGREVTWRLLGLGCKVLVHDPAVPPDEVRTSGAEPTTLEELISRCDAVTLHAPGGQRLVDGNWMQNAKHRQVIINTARADLVDETAVAAGLRSGELFAYAADTLVSEGPDQRSPLLSDDLAEHVLITPHIGAQTVEAVDRMGQMAVDSVLDVLAGRQPQHMLTQRSEATAT